MNKDTLNFINTVESAGIRQTTDQDRAAEKFLKDLTGIFKTLNFGNVSDDIKVRNAEALEKTAGILEGSYHGTAAFDDDISIIAAFDEHGGTCDFTKNVMLVCYSFERDDILSKIERGLKTI